MDTNEAIATKSDFSAIVARYGSMEIAISQSGPVYMFRIRNISSAGIGILVKEDSAILKHLKVGDKLNIKYNPVVTSELPEYLQTIIKHIIKDDKERFKGHCWVDFSVLKN